MTAKGGAGCSRWWPAPYSPGEWPGGSGDCEAVDSWLSSELNGDCSAGEDSCWSTTPDDTPNGELWLKDED